MSAVISSGPQWFAAYVRSRHETSVAAHPAGRSVESFLPQYKSKREWKDRSMVLPRPLFPGYIFVRIPVQERLRVLEAPGVIYLVGWKGYPQALQDSEIEQLKAGVDERLDPRPHEFITVGDRVVVTRGPMEGYEGILLRDKNSHRVVLSLDLIQRSMSIEVDADSIAMARPLPGHLTHGLQCQRG